jgi:hypothetical protein
MVPYAFPSQPPESSGYFLDLQATFKYKCTGYCSQYLFKILYRGRSRSRYTFTDSDSTQNSFRLRLHSPDQSCTLLVPSKGKNRTIKLLKASRMVSLPVTVRINYIWVNNSLYNKHDTHFLYRTVSCNLSTPM